MVYAVITDMTYPDRSVSTKPTEGLVRLVNKGEIQQPADVPGGTDINNPRYHSESYYSNYKDAKTSFKQIKDTFEMLGYTQVQFHDLT